MIEDKKLEQLLEKHEQEISEWVEIINESHRSCLQGEQPENDKNIPLYALSGVLGKISELFFKYGSFKDTFDNSKMFIHVDGPALIIRSSKTGIQFDFGIDRNSIYLHCYFREALNLRHMTDDFYRDLLSLDALGTFKVSEYEGYSFNDNYAFQDVFANNKSNVFKILRQYFAGVSRGDLNGLGYFEISWNTETDFSDIVRNACLAFKTLYKMNYSLWKIADLQSKEKPTN